MNSPQTDRNDAVLLAFAQTHVQGAALAIEVGQIDPAKLGATQAGRVKQ